MKITKQVDFVMSLIVEEGQTVEASDHFEAEASDMLEVSIPGGSVVTTIDLQPSDLDQLQALIIRVISPTVGGYTGISFKVDDDSTVRTLDAPLILIGKGNIALLGETVNQLKFTNTNATIAKVVQILVARTAIVSGS